MKTTDSLDTSESDAHDEVREAWRLEIERRMAELDSGTVATVPWEVVKAKLMKIIND